VREWGRGGSRREEGNRKRNRGVSKEVGEGSVGREGQSGEGWVGEGRKIGW
jgi:hypothetical protein